jgi:hypothetical protein
MLAGYDGVRVFSATKAMEREALGQKATDWIDAHDDIVIVDTVVRQSSDNQFHCLTIIIFYRRR